MTTDSTREPLWTRNFLLAFGVGTTASLIFYMGMTTMVMHAMTHLGADEREAGVAAGLFVIGALAGRVVAGKTADVWGRRRLIIVSLAAMAVTAGGQALVDSLWVTYLYRLVCGAGFGIATSTLAATVLTALPSSRRGEGAGWFGLYATTGTALGPLLALAVSNRLGTAEVFAVAGLVGAVGLGMALLLEVVAVEATEEQRRRARGWRPRDILEFRALPMASIVALMGIGSSATLAYLNPYATELGYPWAASAFYGVYALVGVVSRPAMGRVLDRRGPDLVVVLPVLAYAGAHLILAVGRHPAWFLVAGALAGFGLSTITSTGQAIAVTGLPLQRFSMATSTFYIGLDLGTGIGPLLIGTILVHAGMPVVYLVTSTLAASGLLVYLRFQRPATGPGPLPAT